MLKGPTELVVACFEFTIAQLAQTIIRGGVLSCLSNPFKTMALVAADFGMLAGLCNLARNGNVSEEMIQNLAVIGAFFVIARGVKPKWLHPDLASFDMLFIVIVTGVQAYDTGNTINAFSRLLAFAGYMRLSVDRARDLGRLSIFEIETQIPALLEKIRARH